MWALKRRNEQPGFTIVELLIVIVVIGILAGIAIVAYSGIQNRAKVAALQSNISQAAKKLESYKVTNNDTYPANLGTVGITAPTGTTYNYQVNGNLFCLSASSSNTSYKVTNSNTTPVDGTCSGVLADGSVCPSNFIVVPGNSSFGTNDFCVAKYEMRQVSSTVPVSQPSGSPWVSITQTNAIAYSANVAGCTGCHLVSEAEWMTIAANVLSVGSNWSGGVPGSGLIYGGHNDGTPNNALAASTDDSEGYDGTGNAGGWQRRTLTLTNGEVIWDLSGNLQEWTSGTIAGGQQPGLSGESTYTWKQWNNPSLLMNGLPTTSRPSAISGAVAGYSSNEGIGQLHSNYGETGVRAIYRGGFWGNNANAGVLSMVIVNTPTTTSGSLGFRVAR